MAVYKNHTIQQGETLPFLAQRYFRDLQYWETIASYNNLKYPYIVDTVQEKMKDTAHTVTYGDTIIIPLDQTDTDIEQYADSLSYYERESMYGFALGKDLHLTSDEISETQLLRDSYLTVKEDLYGDILTAEGKENLKQALKMRLLTYKGSYLGHPDYGSYIQDYIGRYNNVETDTLVTKEIERTLRSDGRVHNVEIGDTYVDGTRYYGQFFITPISFEEVVEFVITTEGLLVAVS